MSRTLLIARYPIGDGTSVGYLKNFNIGSNGEHIDMELTDDITEAIDFGSAADNAANWFRRYLGIGYGVMIGRIT